MSGQGNGQSGPYRVRMSAQTRTIVLQLHNQALKAGTGQQFLNAFRQILERLRRNPDDFGEAMYRLPALRLVIRHAVVLPLAVYFGVHEDQPIVFIRGFKVLS